MKGNKGFTLVELLAIIVILGIIAVITTPVVLGVIDQQRVKAAENSAWGTIEAIRYAYAEEKIESGTTINIVDVTATDNRLVRINGDKPTAGTFTINTDGDVIITDFKFGDYLCSNTAANLNTITCAKPS